MSFNTEVWGSGWVLAGAIAALILAIIFFAVAAYTGNHKEGHWKAALFLYIVLAIGLLITSIILFVLYGRARQIVTGNA